VYARRDDDVEVPDGVSKRYPTVRFEEDHSDQVDQAAQRQVVLTVRVRVLQQKNRLS
jgi:hypothetical protein